jgi:hypothetical protein
MYDKYGFQDNKSKYDLTEIESRLKALEEKTKSFTAGSTSNGGCIFPIGTILLMCPDYSKSPKDPVITTATMNRLYGGTWELLGAGRTLMSAYDDGEDGVNRYQFFNGASNPTDNFANPHKFYGRNSGREYWQNEFHRTIRDVNLPEHTHTVTSSAHSHSMTHKHAICYNGQEYEGTDRKVYNTFYRQDKPGATNIYIKQQSEEAQDDAGELESSSKIIPNGGVSNMMTAQGFVQSNNKDVNDTASTGETSVSITCHPAYDTGTKEMLNVCTPFITTFMFRRKA